ncbi:MAG: hypothetical protein WC027_02865 [Candidatus Paceibacterota bacterium]
MITNQGLERGEAIRLVIEKYNLDDKDEEKLLQYFLNLDREARERERRNRIWNPRRHVAHA